jgi:6-phosphogluconolactonase
LEVNQETDAVPIFAFSGSLTRSAPQYAEANGRGITAFSFDEASGKLAMLSETTGIDDTAWVTLDPARHRLFVTCEISAANQSSIAAYNVNVVTGALDPINRQTTGGNEACHASLSPDGKFALVANYNGVPQPGTPDQSMGVLPLGKGGSLGAAIASVRHVGHGPNADRQTAPHAHCVVPSPDGRFVYVADLGIDRIVVYSIDGNGSLTPRSDSDLVLPPGLGPRHFVFSSDGKMLFMVSELIPTVVSARVDVATGRLTQLDAFSIVAPGSDKIQPAGIILSADGRFLFVGLRLVNQILGLTIAPDTGVLRETGRWPSGGVTPRDFALAPSGRHLLVANQDSDRISVFNLDRDAGTLTGPTQQLAVGTPMSIKIAEFPPQPTP